MTRCLEIWGRAPFGGGEEEFETMMDALEDSNKGIKSERDGGADKTKSRMDNNNEDLVAGGERRGGGCF